MCHNSRCESGFRVYAECEAKIQIYLYSVLLSELFCRLHAQTNTSSAVRFRNNWL